MQRLRRVALLAGSALAVSYTSAIASEVSPSRYREIRFRDSVTAEFEKSNTIRRLVNPRNFGRTADSYERAIELPASLAYGLSTEALLACLVRGFFGSWIFWPEGVGLRVVPMDVGEFSGESPSGLSDGKSM